MPIRATPHVVRAIIKDRDEATTSDHEGTCSGGATDVGIATNADITRLLGAARSVDIPAILTVRRVPTEHTIRGAPVEIPIAGEIDVAPWLSATAVGDVEIGKALTRDIKHGAAKNIAD